MAEKQRKSVISIALDAETLQAADRLADDFRISRSAVISMAVNQWYIDYQIGRMNRNVKEKIYTQR